jgi:membrane protein involved in colicin uptake
MSWIDPNSKLRDMLKTAEKIVEEDKKREFAAAEEVRLAAELKARQESEARAVAELKAKQEADAKAAAELKVKLEAEAMAAAELKAKQEAEAKAAALKKTTITCVKGKLTKKVTAVKPKCPSGYKLKK